MIDDRLGYFRQGAAALLDRLDQPLGGVDLPLDVFPLLGRRRAARQPLAIVAADVQGGRAAVIDDDLIMAVLGAIDHHVRRDGGDERLAEPGPRLGIELAQLVPGFANRID
jgi:hypothetical protein